VVSLDFAMNEQGEKMLKKLGKEIDILHTKLTKLYPFFPKYPIYEKIEALENEITFKQREYKRKYNERMKNTNVRKEKEKTSVD